MVEKSSKVIWARGITFVETEDNFGNIIFGGNQYEKSIHFRVHKSWNHLYKTCWLLITYKKMLEKYLTAWSSHQVRTTDGIITIFKAINDVSIAFNFDNYVEEIIIYVSL